MKSNHTRKAVVVLLIVIGVIVGAVALLHRANARQEAVITPWTETCTEWRGMWE